MALKDVKQYYYKMTQQHITLQEDLADFEEAFRAGKITEDKLDYIKEEISRLEENKNRLAYILFLFELPTKKDKKTKRLKQDVKLVKYFDKKNATDQRVVDENTSILTQIRAELRALTDESK